MIIIKRILGAVIGNPISAIMLLVPVTVLVGILVDLYAIGYFFLIFFKYRFEGLGGLKNVK